MICWFCRLSISTVNILTGVAVAHNAWLCEFCHKHTLIQYVAQGIGARPIFL